MEEYKPIKAKRLTPEQGGTSDGTRPISRKQMEMLNVIARGNPDGTYVDRHQLRSRLSYDPHIQSVHFSLRYMFAQGKVEIVGKERRASNTGAVCKTRVYRISELGRMFISSL